MKKIEELEKFEGNGKVILLNTDNGHWARMSKEWYNRSIQTVEEKEKFGQMLEERFISKLLRSSNSYAGWYCLFRISK